MLLAKQSEYECVSTNFVSIISQYIQNEKLKNSLKSQTLWSIVSYQFKMYTIDVIAHLLQVIKLPSTALLNFVVIVLANFKHFRFPSSIFEFYTTSYSFGITEVDK